MKHITTALSISILTSMSISAANHLTYPEAPKDATVDEYFGTKVADPYRPLENDTAAATVAWVEAENRVTNDYLSKIPFREDIRKRLTDLANYKKIGTPWLGYDNKYYYSANDGLQNQSVIYRKATLDSLAEVFLDPNKLSDDGTVALTGLSMSPDGKYMAYTISRSGSDWTEIYVMDTATGKLLDDHITWAKFTGATWYGDGFYYSAYDQPVAGKEFSNSNENHRIYYHKLGTPQSEDTLFYSDPEHPLHFHSVGMPEESDYIILSTGGEGIGNAVAVRNLKEKDSQWIVLEPTQDYNIGVVDVRDGKAILLSFADAPKGRIMVADLANPTRENWKVLVPEQDGVLTSIAEVGKDHYIIEYEKDASTHLYLYTRDGKMIREIKLPSIGSAGVSTDRRNEDVFLSFTSFIQPAASYRYDIHTDKLTPFITPEVNGFNPDDYVTEQVFYTSADGTRVPMSLTYKKGLKRDGKNPVYLYGYGGFNVSLTPSFSPYRLLWLENGGIYAQTNLRGGSEYGEEWHEAGSKQKKLNVFNDFISAAEYMIKEGWTNPDMLVCEGGSNGGLLIGATINMRPDLFRVAIPRVGVMDMMRYHLFTIGWNWASDYGTSADSPEMAAYLLGYSPLHNIKNDGTRYPSILVTTADHDDRVVPAHSFKYAATLQASDTGDNPKLIRIDSKAGHGAGKPISKVIDEYTDIYSFIFENLGVTPKK
ncbi:MAG: S9 family peptidase [Muribaculaceae bacterium]|jgi:hypothetical protein|nr:S9 family peptidase [Muribaculaceae bacterium]